MIIGSYPNMVPGPTAATYTPIWCQTQLQLPQYDVWTQGSLSQCDAMPNGSYPNMELGHRIVYLSMIPGPREVTPIWCCAPVESPQYAWLWASGSTPEVVFGPRFSLATKLFSLIVSMIWCWRTGQILGPSIELGPSVPRQEIFYCP